MNLASADRLADQWIARLSPFCSRIEVVGSVRRRKPDPKDIEILAIPKVRLSKNLFGDEVPDGYYINDELTDEPLIKNGNRYKQIGLNGMNLDLFLVLPPAQWGYLMAIRTGPLDFSKWLVTPKRLGGGMPSYLTAKDGSLWNRKTAVPTPEERTFFTAMGLNYIEPEDRDRWKSMLR